MSAALVLTAAGLVSWVLRVLFIVLVPAHRLPQGANRAVRHTGPAALAALVATGLARSGSGGSPAPLLLALLAAALVARHTRSPLVATGAGVGAFALLTL
jgi:branched-subunit amino acid transport protein